MLGLYDSAAPFHCSMLPRRTDWAVACQSDFTRSICCGRDPDCPLQVMDLSKKLLGLKEEVERAQEDKRLAEAVSQEASNKVQEVRCWTCNHRADNKRLLSTDVDLTSTSVSGHGPCGSLCPP